MTRAIYLINTATRSHIKMFQSNNFDDALDYISWNDYTAIDIKFDMDGDIVIFCMPIH